MLRCSSFRGDPRHQGFFQGVHVTKSLVDLVALEGPSYPEDVPLPPWKKCGTSKAAPSMSLEHTSMSGSGSGRQVLEHQGFLTWVGTLMEVVGTFEHLLSPIPMAWTLDGCPVHASSQADDSVAKKKAEVHQGQEKAEVMDDFMRRLINLSFFWGVQLRNHLKQERPALITRWPCWPHPCGVDPLCEKLVL